MPEFIREKSDKYGRSMIKIEEIQMNGTDCFIRNKEKLLKLKPLIIDFPGASAKCYFVIEKYLDYNIINIDLLYGQINLEAMQRDSSYREKILSFLTRANIESITRNRLGIFLPDSIYSNDGELIYNAASAIANAINAGDAYKVGYINNTRVNNTFENEKISMWDALKELVTGNPAQPKNSDNSYLHQTGRLLMLYQSGMVIVDGIVCPKFTYIEKDVVSEKIVTDTFFVSGLDMEKFDKDINYQESFLNTLAKRRNLTTLRESRESGKIDFTYLGDYNQSDVFSSNKRVLKAINQINDLSQEHSK